MDARGGTPDLADLRRAVRGLADPERAAISRTFFKTGPGEYGEGDRFLGVTVPELRQLARAFRDAPLAACRGLLASPWHEERLLGLLLAVVYLRRRGESPLGGKLHLCEIGVAAAVVCAAINYWLITPQVKAVQGQLAERYGAFHLADPGDALYAQFTGLHQTSTALFMLSFAAALLCLVCLTQFRSRVGNGSSA